jgi:ADP-ribose pyrophosphatase YjhB (NUDIX family)
VYYPHVAGSSSALVIKDNKVLLVQRAREPHKGKWMMPAGFIDYGEHPAECALREVKEETGYNATSAQLLDVMQVTDDNRPGTMGHFGFMHKVEIDDSDPIEISDKEENSAVEWHNLDNLPEIAWENHRLILDKAKRLI